MNNRQAAEKVLNFLTKLWETGFSMVKILLQSRRTDIELIGEKFDEIVVLGNGPSLRPFVESKRDFFEGKALLAVNYAVLSDYYTELKPSYYVIADPAFFFDPKHCHRFFDALANQTTWPLGLYLSREARKSKLWQAKLANHSHIQVRYFNMTPVEGFTWFTHFAYSKGWGTPRPRNVLIPSIMFALQMPFQTIYVAGADHSWLKEIWVSENNVVMEDLNHFYNKKGAERYVSDKRLHDLLLSMHIAFRSYHFIEAYAKSIGKRIYNITEGSFIDAFDRKKIE